MWKRFALAGALLLVAATVFAVTRTITLNVSNMTCAVCPITVRAALNKVPGVRAVQVSLKSHTAVVSYDPERTRPAALTAATADAGYPSTVVSNSK